MEFPQDPPFILSKSKKGFDKSDWIIEDKEDILDFVEEAFEDELEKYPFDSKNEALNFILGKEEYRDRNSFFYNLRDFYTQLEEFEQILYCPHCLEEFEQGEEQDFTPLLTPNEFEKDENPYRYGNTPGNNITLVYCPRREHREDVFINYED